MIPNANSKTERKKEQEAGRYLNSTSVIINLRGLKNHLQNSYLLKSFVVSTFTTDKGLQFKIPKIQLWSNTEGTKNDELEGLERPR